jgi:alanine racemase
MARPTIAEIDLAALAFNVREISAVLNGSAELLAVVKADAYGHGAVPVARALAEAGVRMLGVACLEEGAELRRAGLVLPVLILAGIQNGEAEEIIRHRLTPVLHNLEIARVLNEEAGKRGVQLPVHLKVDTGMNRLGVCWREWPAVLDLFRAWPNLRIEGLMSHFSAAESGKPEDQAFTAEQTARFQDCLETLKKIAQPRYIHLANSAGSILRAEARYNLVRPGLMLYGLRPSPSLNGRISLKPVLRWKTEVLSMKRVCTGDPVSYGRTFTCSGEAIIATLPVGYADGYSRRLSNHGEVLIRGRRAKIAGIVCMDLTMVDVTEIPGVRNGDEVVLLGRQGSEEISATEMAGWTGTIPYEVLCAIGKRVPRFYLQGKGNDSP